MGGTPQDRVLAEANRLLTAGVTGNVFPGASACLSWLDGENTVVVESVAGKLAPTLEAVAPSTVYDLASLTKSFVAMAALRLVAKDEISLDVRADACVPDVRGGPGGPATLEELLTHRAGLCAWGGFYLDVPHDPGSTAARRWILSEASRRAEGQPGDVIYSDLGYMIAGEVIARVAGGMLDEVVAEHVTVPVGIADSVYFAGALSPEQQRKLAAAAAPTERCEWRARLVRGEVHDENCAALGGVAGHAGMFGTATAVAAFGQTILGSIAGRNSFLPRSLIREAVQERPGGSYMLGWDHRSTASSAAGKRMSQRTFGHMGFTGTSIWCDPERDLVVVLLTNRVHPSRSNERIKGFRPAFHDGVVAAYDEAVGRG